MTFCRICPSFEAERKVSDTRLRDRRLDPSVQAAAGAGRLAPAGPRLVLLSVSTCALPLAGASASMKYCRRVSAVLTRLSIVVGIIGTRQPASCQD